MDLILAKMFGQVLPTHLDFIPILMGYAFGFAMLVIVLDWVLHPFSRR